MLLEREAMGEKTLKASRAAFKVVDAITAVAMEVVVMVCGDRRKLVSGSLAGNRHGMDLTRLFQRAKIAVDGALADRRYGTEGEGVQLVGRERARLACNDGEQRAALARGAPECAEGGRGRLLRRGPCAGSRAGCAAGSHAQ